MGNPNGSMRWMRHRQSGSGGFLPTYLIFALCFLFPPFAIVVLLWILFSKD